VDNETGNNNEIKLTKIKSEIRINLDRSTRQTPAAGQTLLKSEQIIEVK
jgi:hypothetical protein